MQSNDDGRPGGGNRGGSRRPTITTDRPGERRGPFDRILRTTESGEPEGPDRAAVYVLGTIIGLAILLLILLLPPISILSGGGDGSPSVGPGDADTYESIPRGSMPKLPEGLVAASIMWDLAAPKDALGASRITVDLKEKHTETRNLGLYTYTDGKWQRLSDVSLVAGGEAARGDVSSLPGNVAVLKRSQSSLQVAGIMPAGATVDPNADSSLTVVHPIVFLTTPDGGLLGTPPAVPPAGYQVVPGIVTLDITIIDDILRSSELQATHAAKIAEAVRTGNYEGINLDYRGVNPQLRSQFTTFIGLVSSALKADSRTLTLTLAMPLATDGEFDTGAYDWDALGTDADFIEVVAPDLDQELYFQRSEAALKYITGRVDSAKILLIISSQSVERGSDGLRAMSLDEALKIAAAVDVKSTDGITVREQVQLVARNLSPTEGASGLAWDDAARAVTFSYNGPGGKRTVWIANEFSVAFRLELAQRFKLGGVVISDVSRGSADVWAPVQQIADTGDLTLTKPNGELLIPAWAVTDNAGSINPTTGTSVAWTAPAAAGSYTITIIISDGIQRAGQTIPLDVGEAAVPEPDAPAE
jgi:hypothetical protein